jgi:hypothetical protein
VRCGSAHSGHSQSVCLNAPKRLSLRCPALSLHCCRYCAALTLHGRAMQHRAASLCQRVVAATGRHYRGQACARDRPRSALALLDNRSVARACAREAGADDERVRADAGCALSGTA